ncbi:MAG: branched-chain amino acid ABC transporter permease [Actinobacteria bacterium]|nr:branched-chain amino acid ABC transporter permease [Actinomycetota bacterium]
MSLTSIVTQMLMGLTVGANLILLATGLTLVFGLMEIINFAHSALFMLGAYVGYTTYRLSGSFWLALLMAPIAMALLGGVLERFLLRPLREKYPTSHLLPLLLTFGLTLFFEGVAKMIWSADIVSLPKPAVLGGVITPAGVTLPIYWIFALVTAGVLVCGLWLLVERTALGLKIRAATQDPTMAAILGVDVKRLNTAVFALGSALAGVAGVVLGALTSLYPQMGLTFVIDAFIVIVIGGLGSFKGAILGSLLLGQVQSFGVALLPEFTNPLVFLVMAVILIFRPSGIFGAVQRRS